jgi:tyrosyl-tRNA synthetase
VSRFLKLFTTLPMAEVARLSALKGQEINEAKKVLATEATALIHGRAAADAAAETARKTFEQGLNAEGLPTIEADLVAGIGILQANVLAGFASSNGQARRSIQGGAVRVNDVAVSDERLMLTTANLNADGVIKLSLGKKRHVLIRPR